MITVLIIVFGIQLSLSAHIKQQLLSTISYPKKKKAWVKTQYNGIIVLLVKDWTKVGTPWMDSAVIRTETHIVSKHLSLITVLPFSLPSSSNLFHRSGPLCLDNHRNTIKIKESDRWTVLYYRYRVRKGINVWAISAGFILGTTLGFVLTVYKFKGVI